MNKHLNICVERITAPNNHFLQFPTPIEEICIGPDTGSLIKTRCLCPTPWRAGRCDQNHQFCIRSQVCITIYLCSSAQLIYSAVAKGDKGSFKCLPASRPCTWNSPATLWEMTVENSWSCSIIKPELMQVQHEQMLPLLDGSPRSRACKKTDAHLEEPRGSYFWFMFLLCHVFV